MKMVETPKTYKTAQHHSVHDKEKLYKIKMEPRF
jgi:hypothetical protein